MSELKCERCGETRKDLRVSRWEVGVIAVVCVPCTDEISAAVDGSGYLAKESVAGVMIEIIKKRSGISAETHNRVQSWVSEKLSAERALAAIIRGMLTARRRNAGAEAGHSSWSTAKPTVPGWYWIRLGESEPWITYLSRDPHDDAKVSSFLFPSLAGLPAQYAGPLADPE